MQFTTAVLLVVIFPILVDILTINYIFKNPRFTINKKIGWIVLVCLLPIFGAMSYFAFQKFKS
jgi:hypothetical protein